MEKFITVSEFRELHSQLHKEEISYSRMVEIINEKAAKHFLEKEIDVHETVRAIVDHLIGPASHCLHPVYCKWQMNDVTRTIEKNFVVTKRKA